MFPEIHIENFRGFADVRLQGLGRVNLVVGKNNTGKTSLLEAITLLANPDMIKSLPGLFRSNAGQVGDRFYRWLLRDAPDHPDGKLVAGDRKLVLHPFGHFSASDLGRYGRRWMVPNAGPVLDLAASSQNDARVHAVSVQHRSPDAMVDAFAEAVRAPVDEKQMESLLASVDPRIKSVRLDSMDLKPFIAVDVGLSSRVPLSQAGQGVYRLVAIFSELLGSKPNICFIDEIENGIHYSALPALWHGIAEAAARLDVQVFATTHSWECLVAAHQTFEERTAYDLRVVQLYRLGESVSGRVLDRAHIKAAVAGEIEVR